MKESRVKNKKLHIKVGVNVVVIAGNNKGDKGRVLSIDKKNNRATVEKVNTRIFHIKPTQKNPRGRREAREGSIHISNLMIIDTQNGTPTRIGRKQNQKGKLQLYAKKTGNFI